MRNITMVAKYRSQGYQLRVGKDEIVLAKFQIRANRMNAMQTEAETALVNDAALPRSADEILRAITEGTAGTTGDEFYRPLAQHLAQALQVRYCFLAECTDSGKLNVRMLA